MSMKKYEKRYYLACIIVAGIFLTLGVLLTLKSINSYTNSMVLKEVPCENMENLGVLPMEDCSIWASQKRDDFNIYELFSKVQEDLKESKILFALTLTFLCLFMPCAYIKEKKKIQKEVEGKEFVKKTYSYAYIPVVMIPLLFSIILFICGFVSNDYRVIAETWNGNVLIYILIYYLLLMVGATLYSLVHINISLICARFIHSYLGASICTLLILFAIELGSTYTPLPSFMNFYSLTSIHDQFAYLGVPAVLLILSSLILLLQKKKKLTL